MELDNHIWQAMIQHTLDDYPNEAVGLILEDEYVRLENVSETPTKSFEVDSVEYVKHKDVVALYHSHPYDKDDKETIKLQRMKFDLRTPSLKDIETHIAMSIPFVICTTEGENVSKPLWIGYETQPLVGRDFIYHVNDCWTLVRDWYKQEKDIELPNIKKEFNWWRGEEPENHYEELYDEAGFVEIDGRDIDVGDVAVLSVGSNVGNHLGVYLGGNMLLHHMYGSPSCITEYPKVMDSVIKVLRFKDE